MAEYYLISQLPSLDEIGESAPVPITEERFFELCQRFLKKKAQDVIESLTLTPPKDSESTGSCLVDAFYESEKALRMALGKIRAEKLKKSFDTEITPLLAEHTRAASAASDMENPMEAERFLTHYRLEMLEALRPRDSFSEDYVFYYGLKLKLISRIKSFNTQIGEEAYKNIYNSILTGERLEEEQ